MPKDVRPIALFAYNTGCRKSEILGLRWDQVDLLAGVVRLRQGETKNGEARVIPLVPELIASLTEGCASRGGCPWVFTRSGERILDFRGAWDGACVRAGKPGALFHDLRRTGVRNLVRAGVSTTVAMAISGHKTDSVFRRYNITSEEDLTAAAMKLSGHLSALRVGGTA